MSEGVEGDGGARVLARTPRPPRWMARFLVLQGVLLAYNTRRLVAEGGTTRVVVIAVGVALLAFAGAMLVRGYRHRGGAVLVLTDAELRLERRVHPVVVARDDVLAVRGNIPGRPQWSERMCVQTRDGVVDLPPLDRSPAVLVPAVQEWAGVSEEVAPPPGG